MKRFGVLHAGLVALAAASLLGVVGCGGDDTAAPGSTTVPDSTAAVDSTDGSTAAPTSNAAAEPNRTAVIISFPDVSSVAAWRNVDDSVMGGVSASTSSWVSSGDRGAMEFTGDLSTDNNGGFASTLSRVDSDLGMRASGSRALGLRAFGDGRTYLLQLRAGPGGADRWISRFTPPAGDNEGSGANLELPLESFEPVNQFLRPVDPMAAFDPASITQIGIYVLDGQVGSFRLVLESISAVR